MKNVSAPAIHRCWPGVSSAVTTAGPGGHRLPRVVGHDVADLDVLGAVRIDLLGLNEQAVPLATGPSVDPQATTRLRLDRQHPDVMVGVQEDAEGVVAGGQAVDEHGPIAHGPGESSRTCEHGGPDRFVAIGRADGDHALLAQELAGDGWDRRADTGRAPVLTRPSGAALHRTLTLMVAHGFSPVRLVVPPAYADQKNPQAGSDWVGAGAARPPVGA